MVFRAVLRKTVVANTAPKEEENKNLADLFATDIHYPEL
jgi:hypothetical protein